VAYRDEEQRRLPMLERIEIASPCRASWKDMAGDERVRFCATCAKHVYDLSAMTREEAAALVAGSSRDRCFRLYRRRDGTVLTTDCPVGVARRHTRRAALATTAAAMLAAGFVLAAAEDARTPHEPPLTPDDESLGGYEMGNRFR
jgi:hypothetical protein